MRTSIIPAQITSVEDKIAGSLNITQIILLMIPVIFTSVVYAFFPPKLNLSFYKFPLVFSVLLIFIILAFRIKDKVILNWLIILLKFNIRAKYYIFNKNDNYLRDIKIENKLNIQNNFFNFAFYKQKKKIKSIVLRDSIKIKNFIENPEISLSLKPNSKGGLYVSVDKIKE